jgi:F-type H+-transporting ATPase subunit delta
VSSEPAGVSGLAQRYATALFELADERRALDQVAGDLEKIGAMIDAAPDLRRLLRSPVLKREEQARALDAVLAQAGISDLTRRFAGLVARNRRLFAFDGMVRGFRALLALRRGEVTAEVTSAVELSKQQLDAITDALKRTYGAKVAVAPRVDPSLLGGLVVRVGSRMIDASLRSKLHRLQIALKGAA